MVEGIFALLLLLFAAWVFSGIVTAMPYLIVGAIGIWTAIQAFNLLADVSLWAFDAGGRRTKAKEARKQKAAEQIFRKNQEAAVLCDRSYDLVRLETK